MNEIVYLNGEFVPKEKAKISPDDRGFVFADGVYEVIKYYNGKPFRFDDHLERLERSLREIAIDYNECNSLKKVFHQLLEKNKLQSVHAGVYLQITRGQYKRIHHFPANIKPTVYAFVFPLASFTKKPEKGIKVITHEDIRWQRCDIKSVALLPNTMLYNKAVENGAGECVLVRNGIVTEATHSSVFGIKNGVVLTHPSSNLILPGITRKVVLEICEDNKISYEEKPFTLNELYGMDELFITGTSTEIVYVSQVNDTLINAGKRGKITNRIKHYFDKLVLKNRND